MAGNQLDNIQLLDASSPYLTRSQESTDIIQQSARWEFQSDVEVQGNLIVQNLVSHQQEEIRTEANYLVLNDGYALDAAQAGGLVHIYDPAPGTFQTTVASGGFTAGVPATSNPTVAVAAASGLSPGDIILITAANDENNKGLYEVDGHTGGVITVRGIGTVGVSAGFVGIFSDQFDTDTTVAGTVTLVAISVNRSGTDGTWESAAGSNTSMIFTDFGAGASTTLQQAYDNDVDGGDAVITTNATDGSVVIAGDQSFRVTATNGLDVDTVFDFDGTSFDVQMTGTNGFSIDGTAASNMSVTAGNLTLSTITSGNVIVSSAGDVTVDGAVLSLDGTDTTNLTMTANNAAARTLTIEATNAGAGAGNIDINADDAITVDSASFSIDSTAASNVSVTGANLTLSTLSSGDVLVSAAGNVDVDGASVLLDATANFSVDGATSSNVTVSGTAAGALDLTLSSTNAGAGTGNVLVSADDEVDVTATTFDVNVTTATIDASGAFSIDGNAASNVTATAANLTLSTVTSGSLLLTSAGDSTYTVPNASAAAFLLTDGTDNYLRVDSVDNSLEMLAPFTDIGAGGGLGIVLTTDATLAAGDIVQVVATTGNVALADADTGSLTDALLIGISQGAFTATNPAQVFTVPGALVPCRMTSAPAASSNGRPVFLSGTAGQATLTPPSGSGVVVFQVGILQGANGASTTPDIIFMPQFISRGPTVS